METIYYLQTAAATAAVSVFLTLKTLFWLHPFQSVLNPFGISPWIYSSAKSNVFTSKFLTSHVGIYCLHIKRGVFINLLWILFEVIMKNAAFRSRFNFLGFFSIKKRVLPSWLNMHSSHRHHHSYSHLHKMLCQRTFVINWQEWDAITDMKQGCCLATRAFKEFVIHRSVGSQHIPRLGAVTELN